MEPFNCQCKSLYTGDWGNSGIPGNSLPFGKKSAATFYCLINLDSHRGILSPERNDILTRYQSFNSQVTLVLLAYEWRCSSAPPTYHNLSAASQRSVIRRLIVISACRIRVIPDISGRGSRIRVDGGNRCYGGNCSELLRAVRGAMKRHYCC